jgi:hypothetical protein
VTPNNSDALIQRLDLLIALTRLAHADAIAAAAERMTGDPVSSAILENTEDWIGAGVLTARAIESTGVAKRTVQRRISDLLIGNVLLQEGATSTVRYKRSGLI